MFHGLELLAPKKNEIDLSNEVLNFDFGQGAAKISEVKVGGRGKYLLTRPVQTDALGSAKLANIFFNLQL